MGYIRYEKKGSLGRITLGRAEASNRLTFEMMDELTALLKEAGEGCAVVFLAAEGADFCAGRESVRGGETPPLDVIRGRFRKIVEMNDALEFSPAVTVAALRGRAFGPGAGLISRTDIVLASSTARLAFPEIREGFPPTVVISHLARKLDRRAGFEMVATGREIDAEEGLRIGMVNRVLPDADLDAAAERLCRELLEAGEESLRTTKAFYRFAETARPEASADHAVNVIAAAIHSKGNVG
ncbi:MAG: enoyl-CoA hydratase/isomerase family protein [bacterium]|nr:enoyl-CoA hydratase/isomerase family protein [bacterium]